MASFKVFVLAFAVTVVFSAAHAQYELENAYPNLTFSQPVDFQHAGDGSNRVFVVEQQGMIKVFDNADTSSTARVFLDIAAKVLSGGERNRLFLARLFTRPSKLNKQTFGRFELNLDKK